VKTSTPQDERILALVDPVADAMGLEVVRVRVMGGKKTTVQIMAERHDGGMDVEDCAKLSRAVSAVFEDEDPISGEYNLEVSSPGIDRPLTALPHFERWEGFEAKLELDRLVEGRKRFRGVCWPGSKMRSVADQSEGRGGHRPSSRLIGSPTPSW
jgi:ribosome maturation factor RimP